ncbi:oocyte zinc finger protein XlCOF7.1 [Solenopsis invicta]|uniref:oocyte zinc finger protein XlCOF7.1 n=1 Tax=Solenopsis invicta TaxID=13686 RepID=UPI00193E0DC3|nr:oocyte zinc finger protein XlCOF7.1 [Solenopsis invicta]
MDEDVIEIESVENVCRLCLSTDRPRSSVFATQDDEKEGSSGVPLATKIQTCLSIQILTTDKLSTLICANCVKNVNQWHTYKESCLRSQDKLQEWLANQIQSNPMVITIKDEPMDFDYEDNVEIISEITNNLEQSLPAQEVENNDSNDDKDDNVQDVTANNDMQDVTDNNDVQDVMDNSDMQDVTDNSDMQDVTDNSDMQDVTGNNDVQDVISNSDVQDVTDNNDVQDVTDNNDVQDVTDSNDVQDVTDNDANDTNENSESIPLVETVEVEKEIDKEESQTNQQDSIALCSIKSEPQDDDTDCTVELESTNSNELLLNSMADETEDIVMEADSTQKSNLAGAPPKKKLRRGPHTHFRGTRVFKQKCTHCQIFLHSKYSFMKHMERFHSKENGIGNLESQNDDEEMVEDLEDELVSMEKDSPLTQVQQDIISQLKTFSCYSCEQTFNDRRSTLSHIRQHLPDLRPYTCIACLTEFPDRSMYQLHCGASFECAMKIALVVPKIGNERYFTCNMCLRSMQGRKELLSHLSKHSDKQYEEMMGPARAPPKLKPMAPLPSGKSSVPNKNVDGLPYKNGDPMHNHVCDLCGMIYRYRPNMLKHKEMCKQLDPQSRTLYKCVHCYMTFLVFNKFHYHFTSEHKKKDFICAVCFSKFRSPSDFLIHHETHREAVQSNLQSNQQMQYDDTSQNTVQTPLKERNAYETNTKSRMSSRISSQKFSCPLCPQEFSTKAELNEHRTLHLKVKIYSCAICRSMFSSAGALEIHMKDHGIEDPNERNANVSCVEYGNLEEDVRLDMNASAVSDPGTQIHKCGECGKVMSSYANLRRHVKIAHRNSKIYDCVECSRMFMRKDLYENHMMVKHNSKKTMIQCPQCPKSFVFQSNFSYHFRTAHLEKSQTGYACDICGKVFVEEASLKIHRGWHNRANSRLSTRFILGNQKSPKNTQKVPSNVESGEISERPARARKSFPNPPLQSPERTLGNFQCQVCNDKFNDVTELRTHLWDVHCARNKAEKSFSNDELQCELCTNIFPDQETLASHMRWHKANPILSDIQKTFSCDVCGKSYSSKKVLWKHKRLHKATVVASFKFQSLARKPMATQFLCNFCRKVFSSSQSLQRHKLTFHSELQNPQRPHQQQLYNNRASFEDEPRTKRTKYDHVIENDNSQAKLSPFAMDFAGERRKPVMCHVCKKMFPNMSVLYKHKQTVHKARGNKDSIPECIPMSTDDGKFSCNICFKEFPGLSNLRQHFTIKHKKAAQSEASNASNNDRLSLPTPERPREVPTYEVAYNNVMYSCKLCKQCHVFNKESIITHITNVHNTVYQADSKTFHREVNLSTYVVKDAIGATCPECDVKYPNNRALKIHYIKFHENAD